MKVRVTMGVRWWVEPYLATLRMLADMFGLEPDREKVTDFIVRYGTFVKVTEVQS